jgi:hypothetical protein
MNPNDNQPIPSDYLNQIAVKPPKKESFLIKQPILVGGVAIVVILVIITILGSMSGGINPSERLAARLISTMAVTEDAAKKIKGADLRALNSDLKSRLTDAIRDIEAPLLEEKLNIKKLDKKVVTAESNVKILATLEDARLNGTYDNTYASEMAYKLETILNLMSQIDNSTKNKDLKSFLDIKSKNLKPIQKQFADFNSTS